MASTFMKLSFIPKGKLQQLAFKSRIEKKLQGPCQLPVFLLRPPHSIQSYFQKMGRKCGPKLANFCLNRIITTQIRARSSPPIHSKTMSSSTKFDQKNEFFSTSDQKKISSDGQKPIPILGRKIMIVVDSSVEAKCALQWVLSHTVQSQDIIVLLHVTKPSKQAGEESDVEINPRNFEFFSTMKNMCQTKRPEVKIEFALVEGKEKGPIIVEEAKKQGTTLLILGQKKRSMTWGLLMMWAGNKIGGGGVVEYCIQNAHCMAIAVRRKSKKLGGYLITTKRHKDFWLLA